MTNAGVVLVFLNFALTAGVIYPSVIPELLKGIITSTPKNARINLTDLFLKTKLIPIKHNVKNELVKSPNEAIDASLYEHVNAKENNVSERSFVFINQRFKTKNHFQNMISQYHQSGGEKSFMIGEDNTRFHELKNRFLSGEPESYSNSYVPNNQIKEAAILYCDPPYQCSDNVEVTDTFRPTQDENEKTHLNNIEGSKRDYMELLKPPLIRSENNPSPEVKDDNLFLAGPEFKRPMSAHPKYGSNNQVNPSDLPHAHEQKSNFEYMAPIKNKLFSGNDLVFKTHNYGEVNDIEQKGLSVDDDKLLDNYLQEKLYKEEGKINKYEECNYRDCVTKSVIKTPSKKKTKKPECQCANKLNLKNPNNVLSPQKDRPERDYYRRTPMPVFPENSEELLINEEDDVAKVINKINDALRL